MTFYRVPTEFFFRQFSALSRCFHSPHNACTEFSWRSHCIDGVVKMHWHTKECHTNSVQTPRTTMVFTQWPFCMPAELLLHCRRAYCVVMVTVQWPHCTLIRTPSDSVCFENTQSARNPTTSTDDATALLKWCLQLYCPYLSTLQFSWTPWDRCENVWQGLKSSISVLYFNMENIWAKIWQKEPSGNKSPKWDIYRKRKSWLLWTITENLKRLSLQITKIWASEVV